MAEVNLYSQTKALADIEEAKVKRQRDFKKFLDKNTGVIAGVGGLIVLLIVAMSIDK